MLQPALRQVDDGLQEDSKGASKGSRAQAPNLLVAAGTARKNHNCLSPAPHIGGEGWQEGGRRVLRVAGLPGREFQQ